MLLAQGITSPKVHTSQARLAQHSAATRLYAGVNAALSSRRLQRLTEYGQPLPAYVISDTDIEPPANEPRGLTLPASLQTNSKKKTPWEIYRARPNHTMLRVHEA